MASMTSPVELMQNIVGSCSVIVRSPDSGSALADQVMPSMPGVVECAWLASFHHAPSAVYAGWPSTARPGVWPSPRNHAYMLQAQTPSLASVKALLPKYGSPYCSPQALN